jgi:protein-serine/threonine kinase
MAPSLSHNSTLTTYITHASPAIPSAREGYTAHRLDPPPIRPIDLGGLDAEEVFAELERTVDDMQRWLGCVESGMDELLSGMDGLTVEAAS